MIGKKQAEVKDKIITLPGDMEWAVENGLFKPLNDGTYRHQELCTREEVASILKRFYELIQKDY